MQGQNGLFGSEPEDAGYVEQLSSKGTPWTQAQLLLAEKAALGFYVTAHPLGDYLDLLQSTKAVKSIDLPSVTSGTRISIGGIINDLQPRTTKKGDRFALLRLEDEAGGTKCVLWPETFRKYSILLKNDLAVLVTGRLEIGEDNPASIIVDQVQSLDEIAKTKELVVLRVPRTDDPAQLFDNILHLINTHSGNCEVVMETPVDVNLIVRVKVSSSLRVQRSEKLAQALREVGCVLRVEKVQTSSVGVEAAAANGSNGV
jgi:DNA polymerase-3 subunit alpha